MKITMEADFSKIRKFKNSIRWDKLSDRMGGFAAGVLTLILFELALAFSISCTTGWKL